MNIKDSFYNSKFNDKIMGVFQVGTMFSGLFILL